MSEKTIFLLLFLEHAYLTNPHMCSLKILGMHSKRSNQNSYLGYFLFYDKKRETFMLFFHIIFLDFIK